jgi:ribonuclease BN (tRNA processing enzyme)
MFEVIPLGVGDTFSDRHVTASLLLRCQGFTLAIDCPDRYRAVLRAAGAASGRTLDLFDIDHLLITHVHGDHMNGLEGAAFFKRFAQQRRLNLLTSAEVRAVIWDQRLKAPMDTLYDGQRFVTLGFDDYFQHTDLPWDAPVEVGPFTLRTYRTLHHVPTSALLIEAGGRRLGYSSDTAFDPALIRFLSDADLIIHETNYGPAHTAYDQLTSLPAELKAKMRLIHYPDAFDVASSEIAVLREGEPLVVASG